MPDVNVATHPMGVSVPTKPVELNYSAFQPSKITQLRDGTIKLDGLVNRSYSGFIRFQGGSFFVQQKFFAGPPSREQPMKKADLEELQKGLTSYVKQHPNAEPAYHTMLANIAQVLGKKPTKLPTTEHLKSVLGAWEIHHAKFGAKKPATLTPDNILKTYTVSKPAPHGMGGATVRAYVLKSDPERVVFEKIINTGMPGKPTYFGPVSHLKVPA